MWGTSGKRARTRVAKLYQIADQTTKTTVGQGASTFENSKTVAVEHGDESPDRYLAALQEVLDRAVVTRQSVTRASKEPAA